MLTPSCLFTLGSFRVGKESWNDFVLFLSPPLSLRAATKQTLNFTTFFFTLVQQASTCFISFVGPRFAFPQNQTPPHPERRFSLAIGEGRPLGLCASGRHQGMPECLGSARDRCCLNCRDPFFKVQFFY